MTFPGGSTFPGSSTFPGGSIMAAPTITSFTPTTVTTAGGTNVTITGTNLTNAAAVLVGSKTATIVSATGTSLVFIAPPQAAAGNQTIYLVDITDSATAPVASGSPLAYTLAPTLETGVSTLARKWALDIDTSAGQDGSNYIPVRFIIDLQPALATTTVDDSDYGSNGYGSDFKTMIKWSVVLKLGRKRGVTTGAYDPGQEALRVTEDQFGAAGTVRVRWYDRTGGSTPAYYGYAQVTWSEDGGNSNDTVSCTLNGQGQRFNITNPSLGGAF